MEQYIADTEDDFAGVMEDDAAMARHIAAMEQAEDYTPRTQDFLSTAQLNAAMEQVEEKPKVITIENFYDLPFERQTSLMAQFGDPNYAIAEYHRRQDAYTAEHAAHLDEAAQDRMVHEHFELRNAICEHSLAHNKTEIQACRERIAELKRANRSMRRQRWKLARETGEAAAKWEADQKKLQVWDSFFELDIDREELLRGLTDGGRDATSDRPRVG